MEVKASELSALIAPNGGNFIIPPYQRDYTWGQEDCEQLLYDISQLSGKLGKKEHFLGTITYIKHETAEGARDDFVVVDGQQRITTIMLLLKALQLAPSVRKNEAIQNEIRGYLFGNSGKARVRLKPLEKDKEAFDCVMSERQFDGKSSSVYENFRFFRREAKRYVQEKIQQMLIALDKLRIAVVELDSERDDPQVVFESINGRGVQLGVLDLIQNFLMMALKPSEQKRIFDEYWKKIKEFFSDKKNSDKTTTDFIRAYLRIYWGSGIKDKDKRDIYKKFTTLRERDFENSSEKILIDMRNFARIYKIIIADADDKAFWQYKNETLEKMIILREKISIINDLDFGVAYPFLMRLIDDFENSRLDFENFNEILNLLISYFVRRAICAVPTPALSSVLYNIYERLKGEYKNMNINADNVARHLGQKSGNEIFPSSVMLRHSFETTLIYKTKKEVATLVLYEIEKSYNREALEFKSLEIEHFYPRTPTEEWRNMVGSEDKIRDLEQFYIDTFGNLTLLETSLNRKVSNKSFDEKVWDYKEKSSLHLNDYFSSCEKWDIDEIETRAQRLCERFAKIDIFKDIKSELRPTRKHITLNSEGEWANLKPYSVKFPNGREIRASSSTNIVKAIIEYLQDNRANELESALRRGFDFIKFEVEKKDGLTILPFGDGSSFFVCSAKGESLRAAAKELVEACDLEPSEFEIITI